MNKVQVLVCINVSLMPNPSNPSVVAHCPQCEEKMWLGPRIAKMHKENPNIPLMCAFCVETFAQNKSEESGEEVEFDILSLGGK